MNLLTTAMAKINSSVRKGRNLVIELQDQNSQGCGRLSVKNRTTKTVQDLIKNNNSSNHSKRAKIRSLLDPSSLRKIDRIRVKAIRPARRTTQIALAK